MRSAAARTASMPTPTAREGAHGLGRRETRCEDQVGDGIVIQGSDGLGRAQATLDRPTADEGWVDPAPVVGHRHDDAVPVLPGCDADVPGSRLAGPSPRRRVFQPVIERVAHDVQ